MGAAGSSLGSTVQITISVVDANSSATVQKVREQIVGLGTAGDAAAVGISKAAKSVATVSQGMGNTTQGISTVGQAWSLTTQQMNNFSNAAVSMVTPALNKTGEASDYLRRKIGLLDNTIRGNLGGAMTDIVRMFEKNQTLMSAINVAAQGAMLMMAAQMGIEIGKGIYDAYENWVSVDRAIDDYNRKAQQAAQQKLFDTASFETTSALLAGINKQIDDLEAKKRAAGADQPGGSILQWLTLGPGGYQSAEQLHRFNPYTAGDSQNEANLMEKRDALQARQTEQQEQFDRLRLQAQNQYSEAVAQGYDQINKKESSAIALALQDLDIARQHEQVLAKQASLEGKQYTPSPNAGQAAFELAYQRAEAEASAARINLKRQETEQIVGLDNQVRMALAANQGEEAVIAEKSYQDQEKVYRDFLQGKISSYSSFEQMILAIQGRSDAETAQFQQRQLAARLREQAQEERAQEQFTGRLNQINANYDAQSMQGYAKIAADFKQHVAQMAAAYQEYVAGMSDLDPRKWTALAGLSDAITEATKNAERERAQYTATSNERILEEETRAARLTLPPWQQTQQAIIDSYNQRTRQIEQDLKQHTIEERQAAGEARAAWLEANAAMTHALEQERNTLAGNLQSLFSDPGNFIKKQAEDLMFKILANWMMQLTNFNGSGSGIIRFLFGMGGEVPTDNSQLGRIFGGGFQQASTLTIAGSTLTTAGTSLTTAAINLNMAAQALQLTSMGGGGFGAGSLFSGLNLTPGVGDLASLGSSTLSLTPGASDLASLGTVNLTPGASDLANLTASQMASTGGVFAGGTGFSLGGVLGAGAGAIGTIQQIMTHNTLGAGISGAMTGASIGMMAGGPVGAVIGAAIGGIGSAITSLFGDHGYGKAADYDLSTVHPALQQIQQQFEAGSAGYDQATKALQDLLSRAESDTSGYGSGARRYFSKYIAPEITAIEADLQRQMAGGRGNITFSAAQFHTGGRVLGFADMATSSTEGFIHAMVGEHVMTPAASARYGATLDAMNRGFDVSGLINSYVRGGSRMLSPVGGSKGDTFTIYAMDSKSFDDWITSGNRPISVAKASNMAPTRYGGKAQY